jgi:predicted transcriptional regulator
MVLYCYTYQSEVLTIKKTLEYSKKQSMVLKIILKSPGVRHRQLLRITGLSNGSLTYNLKKLEDSRSIIVNRTGNNRTSYYPRNIKITELHIIENLGNSIDRRIVQYLLEQGQSTFYDIVNHSKRSPSTVSWHLKRLKNGKVVTSASHNGKPQVYKIINKNIVARTLSKYTGIFV